MTWQTKKRLRTKRLESKNQASNPSNPSDEKSNIGSYEGVKTYSQPRKETEMDWTKAKTELEDAKLWCPNFERLTVQTNPDNKDAQIANAAVLFNANRDAFLLTKNRAEEFEKQNATADAERLMASLPSYVATMQYAYDVYEQLSTSAPLPTGPDRADTEVIPPWAKRLEMKLDWLIAKAKQPPY